MREASDLGGRGLRCEAWLPGAAAACSAHARSGVLPLRRSAEEGLICRGVAGSRRRRGSGAGLVVLLLLLLFCSCFAGVLLLLLSLVETRHFCFLPPQNPGAEGVGGYDPEAKGAGPAKTALPPPPRAAHAGGASPRGEAALPLGTESQQLA